MKDEVGSVIKKKFFSGLGLYPKLYSYLNKR